MTLFVAQSFDLATFAVMVGRHGVAAEANPLVSHLFVEFGMPAVTAVKLLVIVEVAALAVAAWARGGRGVWRLVGLVPLGLAIAVGLVGGITNTLAYFG
jgi:hypothetical protein